MAIVVPKKEVPLQCQIKDLEGIPQGKCEHVYTTRQPGVAMQTRSRRRDPILQGLTAISVGPEIALLNAVGTSSTLKPSQSIASFSSLSLANTEPLSFMASVLAHGVAAGLVFLVLSNAVKVVEPHVEHRYSVRTLNLHETEPQIHWSPHKDTPRPMQHAAAAHTLQTTGGQSVAAALQQLAQQAPAPITLVQPDVPPNTLIPQTPIPTVVILSPEHNPVAKIVPPPPQKAVEVKVQPALSAPNHEWNVSDVNLSASTVVSAKLPVVASTTSPIALPGMQMVRIPQATSNSTASQAASTTVVSLSDVVVHEGTIVLPLANETASGSISESLMPGRADSTADTGNGNIAGHQNGSGAGLNPGGRESPESASNGAAAKTGAADGSSTGSDTGSPSGNGPAVDRITRPKDGQFGVVVVGSSLAEEYPEALGMWADRLAYTVYLHVGAAKSWILQYSLPRAAQAEGNTIRPDAPWPYLIMRPHLTLDDSDADAVMVHGLIDTDGRFEQLAVVFPPQFAQTKFVLDALRQWQFRPATQNGKSTAVEVLLIIPDEQE